MAGSLEGKAILVTGAGGGIGCASALVFCDAGAKLVLTDVNVDAGHKALDAVKKRGGEAIFAAADLGEESDVAKLIGRVVETYGRIDGAFNNAGVAQSGTALHELSTAQWEKALRIDLTAVFWCIKYQVLAMLATGGGSIVNTASSLGMVAIPNAADYIAAKHGVVGLTRAASVEYGRRGIRTNCVLPGIIETPLFAQVVGADRTMQASLSAVKQRHSIGRFGAPAEIGEVAKWLLSDSSSFVNGTAIPVDGGFLAT